MTTFETIQSPALAPRRWVPRPTLWTFAAVLMLLVARTHYLVDFAPERLDSLVPDDAFYYLVLARNHAASGRWTFDGVAPATGFHLLWAYLLSAIYTVWPHVSFASLCATAFTLGSLCIAGAAALLVDGVVTAFGANAAFGALFVASSPVVLFQSTSLMESPLAALFSAAIWRALLIAEMQTGRGPLAAAFAIGALGELARSDFGLQPLVFTAVTGLIMALDRNRWRLVATALSALTGASVALALGLVLNHAASGRWLQASALVKRFWSAVQGDSFQPIVGLMESIVAPVGRFWQPSSPWLVALELAAPIVLLAALLFSARDVVVRMRAQALWITTAILVLLAYANLYALDCGAIQNWYSCSLFAAIAVIVACATAGLRASLAPIGYAAVALAAAAGILASVLPQWPWQKAATVAGLYLRDHPEMAPVASWNAGYVAFFSGRPIINIDGLVNDDIYDRIRADDLESYFVDRGIAYVVDAPTFLTSPILKKRGGYSNGDLTRCARWVTALAPDTPGNRFVGGVISLYRIDRSCLVQ